MVGVAQLVEPRIVIPVVVGSSPIVHPISLDNKKSGNKSRFFFRLLLGLAEAVAESCVEQVCPKLAAGNRV